MTEAIYGDYDQDQLDHQYNNGAWVPDTPEIIATYRPLSDAAHAKLECRRDIRYDDAPGAMLDVFPGTKPNSPILVFIHGGQWQMLAKEDSAFAAPGYVEAGAAFVALNFDLIPDVELDEIVRQVREGIAWVYRNAASMNGDASQLHIAGHSSGGHLAGMMATTDWQSACDLDQNPLAGATCLSGMYDLEPVMLTFRREYLKLDAAGIERNSSIKHLDRIECPLLVGCGEFETDEFRRQCTDFAKAVNDADKEADLLIVEGRNHFDVITTLGDRESPLGQAVMRQMKIL